MGLVRGDVDLHVRQQDWEGHGHSTDPHYNGVILHLVAGMKGVFTTLQSGRQVPVLSLGPLLEAALPSTRPPRDLWSLLVAHGYRPPADAEEMGLLLDRAGDSWFLGERDGFLSLMKEEDPEQVLYASLMEALGYSQNRAPFLELSHRAPYGLLREAAAGALEGGQRLRVIEGLLLTTAGFLPAARNRKAMPLSSWRRFRVRPQNLPERRIMGFARVLDRFIATPEVAPEADFRRRASRVRGGNSGAGSGTGPEAKAFPRTHDGLIPPGYPINDYNFGHWEGWGLLEGVTRLVRASSAQAGDEVRWRLLSKAFTASTRTGTPGRGLSEGHIEGHRGGTLIGEARARDMAVNCVLPFVHALAQQRWDERLALLSMELYHRMPRLQENEITREMELVLFPQPPGAGAMEIPAREIPECRDVPREPSLKVVRNARRQQGLLHLHHLMASPAAYTPGLPSEKMLPGDFGDRA